MKSLFLFLLILVLIVSFNSCFEFKEKTRPILTYKLNPSTSIEVCSVGYGATTKDITEIRKLESSKSTVIKRIDGSYSEYFIARITRLNDTLFKITFTDTANFKGLNKSYLFNRTERAKLPSE